VSYYCGMGLYDRDYAQASESGYHISSPQTITTKLVIVTVAAYVAQLLAGPGVTDFFSLNADWWRHPWEAFRLLTYGFLHSPDAFQHIFWNMFGLWMFGRDVEQRYGPREFLGFYLSAIIFAGLVWSAAGALESWRGSMLGASGGTTAVIILYVLNFPHRTLFMSLLFPVPAWVVGLVIVGGDLMGALGADSLRGGAVAFVAHLGGAAFAYLYYRTRWNPVGKLLGLSTNFRLPKRTKLRVLRPDDDAGEPDSDDEVDRILRKISESGKESLTRAEQRYLERASQEFKDRRRR
jgi:membrane associated rhomboid family serine protease